MLWGPDGNLYGTTAEGGIPGGGGSGTVFRATTNGTMTQLVAFTNANGATPLTALTLGADGKLYGTTSAGGSGGLGTVFQVGTNGDFVTLAAFDGTNGATPLGSLIFGEDGALYGTTSAGGENGLGTIFKLTTDGAFTTLISFSGTPNYQLTLFLFSFSLLHKP